MIYSENLLVCIGAPLLITLFFLKNDSRRFAVGLLAGMGISLLAGYINGFLFLVSGNEIEMTAIYISPVVEEWMKLMPLLFGLFVLKRDRRELLLVAVAIGAGFATFENCLYILQNGVENVFYTLVRGLSVGVMHIVCMVLMNLGLILSSKYRLFSVSSLFGVISVSMGFHGLYNLLVSQPGVTAYIGYGLPLLAAALLYYIFRQIDLNEYPSVPESNAN